LQKHTSTIFTFYYFLCNLIRKRGWQKEGNLRESSRDETMTQEMHEKGGRWTREWRLAQSSRGDGRNIPVELHVMRKFVYMLPELASL